MINTAKKDGKYIEARMLGPRVYEIWEIVRDHADEFEVGEDLVIMFGFDQKSYQRPEVVFTEKGAKKVTNLRLSILSSKSSGDESVKSFDANDDAALVG